MTMIAKPPAAMPTMPAMPISLSVPLPPFLSVFFFSPSFSVWFWK